MAPIDVTETTTTIREQIMASPAAVQMQQPKASNDTDIKATLERRASKELVVAFMGAVGCGLPRVITECERQLKELGYVVRRIKLSKFIKKHRADWEGQLAEEDVGVGYLENQTGGNYFRSQYSYDILAQYAVDQIARYKFAAVPGAGDSSAELPKTAYLIDQIKHPEEALLLRLTYRNIFYLVGVLSTQAHRLSRLKDDGLTDQTASRIMDRDRKETQKYGQHLEKAFKLADYFFQHPLGQADAIPKQMLRFLSLVHGSNSITPTRHEHAMYIAHASGLKSACFSRQVGASILDSNGKLIAVGCNDVPQYGGGLYSSESGINDHRCAYRDEKICENDFQKRSRKEKIRSGLISEIGSLFKDTKTKAAVLSKIDPIVDLAYEYSGVPDLIEFSRAVHAEMDAIVSVAREGSASIIGGTLYTTTFPCHNCARHIVASGIDKVYYIEPYEKSLAIASHSDSIVVLDHDVDEVTDTLIKAAPVDKVKFIHFAGAAPRVYPQFFHREGRKDDEGRFVSSVSENMTSKIMVEFLDSYRAFEAKISRKFEEAFPVEAADADGS